jgi:hypothetical protein
MNLGILHQYFISDGRSQGADSSIKNKRLSKVGRFIARNFLIKGVVKLLP